MTDVTEVVRRKAVGLIGHGKVKTLEEGALVVMERTEHDALLAQATAMKQALEALMKEVEEGMRCREVFIDEGVPYDAGDELGNAVDPDGEAMKRAYAVLASNAGKALAEYVKALEKVAQAAEEAVADFGEDIGRYPNQLELAKALADLDELKPADDR